MNNSSSDHASLGVGRLLISWEFLVAVIVVPIATQVLYRIFFSPLRNVPGPLIARVSWLWLAYHGWLGDECSVVRDLHRKYGTLVRVAPNDVDIADGEALWPIYMDKGGFDKPNYYNTFDIQGHATIFSCQTLKARESRVKAVLPIFSMSSIRGATSLLTECADKLVERLQKVRTQGGTVNLLHHTRAFAMDAVTVFVFCKSFGALDERDTSELSVAEAVDMFISDSQLFYLSPRVTDWAKQFMALFTLSKKALAGDVLVDDYIRSIVSEASKLDGSFEARLASRGISESELLAQCKDALFAGVDTTGNNLAHICYYLAKHPEKYAKLRQELVQSAAPDGELINLPYLIGCIKETLRLTNAISVRCSRVVPQSGWKYDDVFLPSGTTVGVSAFQLHLNDEVFPKPHSFSPERWAEPSSDMARDWLPFGRGARSCIARNLVMTEMAVATHRIVMSGFLDGARATQDKIEVYEWFLSRIKGDRVELVW